MLLVYEPLREINISTEYRRKGGGGTPYALLRRKERRVGERARECRRLLHCHLCANVGGHASQRDTCHGCHLYTVAGGNAVPPLR